METALGRGQRLPEAAGAGEAMGAGASPLGLEVLVDFSTGSVDDGPATFDVTAPVQAWVDGTPNHSWALLPLGANGWDFHTREGATPPQLTVTLVPPSG